MNKLLLILMALLLTCGGVKAEAPVSVYYKRGLKLYKSAQYREAIVEFEAAYERSKLPRLLINMGQAYYELKQMEQALNCFERFLRAEPDAPDALRARVMHRIDEAHRELGARRETVLLPGHALNIELPRPLPPSLALHPPSPVQRREAVPLVRRWWFWGALSLTSVSVLGIALGVSLSQAGGDVRRPIFPTGSQE